MVTDGVVGGRSRIIAQLTIMIQTSYPYLVYTRSLMHVTFEFWLECIMVPRSLAGQFNDRTMETNPSL